MSSIVEICNHALGHLGVDKFIAALDEASTQAKNCNLHYDAARRELLEDFPYGFARGVIALAELSADPPPGWGYAYGYPNDCLQARAISDASGIRAAGLWASSYCSSWDAWTCTIVGRVPWEVMHDPDNAGSRRIVTDIAEAYLWYTVDVQQVSQMPSLFRNALAWHLATKLAGPLRVKPDLRASVAQQALVEISKAQAHALNEARPDRVPESPSIQARN